MAKAIYMVTLAAGSAAATRKQGANSILVFADSDTQAKEMAASYFDGDGGIWSGADATEMTSAADWEGWTFKLTILMRDADKADKVFSYTGTSTNDTIDEIAAQLVTLANADADIAGAAYTAATNTLKVAETTDGLGAKELVVEIIPPGGYSSVASLVGTIVDKGEAAAVLSVVLPADADVPPKVLSAVKTT